MKVLIIEDDFDIVDSISITIRMAWPEVKIASTGLGEEGINLVGSELPDIVILDLALPDMSGFDVLRQVRLFSSVPILILTVSGEEQSVVKALEMGANEYLIKPFRQMEFLARVRLLLRRQGLTNSVQRFNLCKLQFAPYTHTLYSDHGEVHLSNTESSILAYLYTNKNRVVTFSALANILWGIEYPGYKAAIHVYIRRLRQKVEVDASRPKYILAKTGIGYYLQDTE